MKAARIIAPNKPLELTNIEIPKPGELQAVVKVKSAGVCHSDLHLWEGGYDLGDGVFLKVTDRGVKYPITPGHEIVGTITEIGKSVSNVVVGDNVLIYPWIGCGFCPACRVGNDNLCDTPRSIGLFQDGGYAEYVLVPNVKFLVKVEGIDLDAASSLACSGLTAYTAIKKANTNSQQYLVIIGAGGLGLMGVQLARALTSSNIICVDLDDNKLETAKKMGADYIVNSKNPKAIEEIMAICKNKGADCIVDFVNAPPTAKMGLSIIRKCGKLILVGLFGGSINLSLPTIPMKSITIEGAYTGNYNDLVELLGLAKRGIINPMVSKKYTLSEANTALDDLKQRKILGRAVINP